MLTALLRTPGRTGRPRGERSTRGRLSLAWLLLTALVVSIAGGAPAAVAQNLATPIVDYSSEAMLGDWFLTCAAPSDPVTPGADALVTCTVAAATLVLSLLLAWLALRKQSV